MKKEQELYKGFPKEEIKTGTGWIRQEGGTDEEIKTAFHDAQSHVFSSVRIALGMGFAMLYAYRARKGGARR